MLNYSCMQQPTWMNSTHEAVQKKSERKEYIM